MDVFEMIKFHEGFRATPYRDTRGVLTIGYGQRVDELSISEKLALQMLQVKVCNLEVKLAHIDWFGGLDSVRQDVIIDMAYQLGIDGVLGFHEMIAHIEYQDWSLAANAMLDSDWAKQTPARAKQLAAMMRTGEWPEEPK